MKEFAQVQKFFDSAFLFTTLPCLLCYRKSTVSSRLFIPLSLSLFLRLHHCILTAGTWAKGLFCFFWPSLIWLLREGHDMVTYYVMWQPPQGACVWAQY